MQKSRQYKSTKTVLQSYITKHIISTKMFRPIQPGWSISGIRNKPMCVYNFSIEMKFVMQLFVNVRFLLNH